MTASDASGHPMRAEIHAWRIADAAAAAWWKAGGGDEIGIPLGVLAALSLVTAAGQPQPGLADQISTLGQDQFAALLSRIWGLFAIARPELAIRCGPFARWLEDENTESRRDAAYALARALLIDTAFPGTAGRDQFMGADLLGCAYQALADPRRTKARGEVYTSGDAAGLLMRIKLAGATPGQSILDECAGTGSFMRAAAQVLRDKDIDPQTMYWYAVDTDPIAVAALAVNAHLWELGPHVVLARANVLTEPDWPERAREEQAQALRDYDLRVTVARLLAAEHVISTESPGEPRSADLMWGGVP